jgi:hypothetical protein
MNDSGLFLRCVRVLESVWVWERGMVGKVVVKISNNSFVLFLFFFLEALPSFVPSLVPYTTSLVRFLPLFDSVLDSFP